MEKTPKSKVNFKSRYQDRDNRCTWFDNSSSSNCINMKNIMDLETRSVFQDVLKTSPVKTTSNLCNGVCQTRMRQESPQFRVGWNDGSQKNDCEMISPISALPVSRRIRRCPDNLLYKATNNISSESEDKTEKENESDILRCIDWAKNLIDCASPEKENSILSSNNNIKIAEVASDIVVDILDDSTNEAMILCSQAIEKSVPCLEVSPVSSKNTNNKRPLTPEKNSRTKRMKSEYIPYNSKFENTNRKFNGYLSTNHITNEKLVTTCVNIKSKRDDCRITNEIRNDKNTMVNCNNNNDEKSSNFNYNDKIFNCANGKKLTENLNSINEMKILNTSLISSKISNLPVCNEDPIKSQLDKDDDEFCSLDFNIVDTLEHSVGTENTRPLVPKFEPTTTISNSVKIVSVSKPLPKYTKEQIERRRMEAKKRLLFNKKHKSI